MKRKDYENQYPDPWDRGTYQTGSTNPPKRHSGLIAVLLVMVIFLAGMVSILSILNIRLFSTLYSQQTSESPLALKDESQPVAPAQEQEAVYAISNGIPGIGITGDAVTSVYQKHFDLPEGLFITEITEGSDAAAKGLQEGDILLFLGGTQITDQESLDDLVMDKNIGDRLKAVIYRHDTGTQLTLELIVEETAE